jgi:2-phospho-L-lactate guanylyltransferase
VATIVVPFRRTAAKRRLGPLPDVARLALSEAMAADVLEVCRTVAPTRLADGAGGQGKAVAEALRGVTGRIAVLNADLPCARPADVEALLAAAPALVAAADGTTNALALADAGDFRPLYGPGSAARFAALGLVPLELPGLADDVDTPADLERVAERAGPRTRAALEALRARA